MVQAFSPQGVWGDETWGWHPRLGWGWACGPRAPTPVMNAIEIWEWAFGLNLVLARKLLAVEHQGCVLSQPGVTTPGNHPPPIKG
jgi:hypothetical protein